MALFGSHSARWWRPVVLLVLAPALPAAPWIAITEIHFHPAGSGEDAAAGEFVEILNRQAPRADLSRWRLEGEIEFEFPDGVTVHPGEYIVVARHPRRFVAEHPDAGRVFGPFTGALDNQGGKIRLLTPSGGISCEARWGARSPWPASTCGAGHTLSIVDPQLDPAQASSWSPSRRRGGTPGHPNFAVEPLAGTVLVARGAGWRFATGLEPPGPSWHRPEFDDSTWQVGPGGFGYEDGDDATVIDDMSGRYMTVYTRHELTVADPSSLNRLVLRVDYDDGFAAFLNGREVARANLGAPATPIGPEQAADTRHEAGAPVEFDIGTARDSLVAGRNVLAVEVHNDNLTSSDLTLIVELLSRDDAVETRRDPLLNEVHAAGAASFVEIYNPNAAELDLGGAWISDDPQKLKKHQLRTGFRVPPRGLAAVRGQDAGGALSLSRPDGFLALTSPDGERVLDAVHWPAGPHPDLPRGRQPDGEMELAVLPEPTPGALNRRRPPGDLVINEIHYHAPAATRGEEFVELHNRGAAALGLEGFRLASAVRFSFPGTPVIPPGGFVVVAANPEALASRHGLDRALVFGPYEGSLSGKGEDVMLQDDWGNAADRVRYADRDPWPRWADGLGSSLELVDPFLDNSLAAAWSPSAQSAEAGWQSFTVTGRHQVFQGHNFPELQFLLLDEGECLIDDVQVSGGVLTETFENAVSGWSALGNHHGSGRMDGDAAQGKGAFRIASSGRGNPRHNYVSRMLSRSFRPGREYTVQFRARWVRGCPLLLVRSPGQGLARACELALPARIGTPGAVNSRRAASPVVVAGAPALAPIVPASGQPVVVAAPISFSGASGTAQVRYQPRGEAKWRAAPLADDGVAPDARALDGIWTGVIPGTTADAVSFFIGAHIDAASGASFPLAGADAPAMYPVGPRPAQAMPSYVVLVPDAQWRRLEDRPRMSNDLLRATFVHNNTRIFYDVKFRVRGSPFTRSERNWRLIFGADNLDGRRSLTLDGQGGDGRRPNERLTYWLINELLGPTPRQQYVRLSITGREEERIYEDVEKVDERFCERWFPPAGGAGGLLHKVDDHWELGTSGEQVYRDAELRHERGGSERHRWSFPPRGSSFDLDAVAGVIAFLDPQATSDEAFDDGAAERIDAAEWIRVLAARAAADDWDTLGRARGKNAFLYLPGGSTRWQLIPWDCDLAWQQNPHAPLRTHRFDGIERLLERPRHWRHYLACMWYLAERSLAAERIDAVIGDLERATRARLSTYRAFAAARREFLRSEISRGAAFRVDAVERRERTGGPDTLWLAGTAPIPAVRIRLAGRDADIVPDGEDRWTAEVPVGPAGGAERIQALDFGRQEVAFAGIEVPARAGATPLPPLPEVLELRGQNAARPQEGSDAGVASTRKDAPGATRRTRQTALERLAPQRAATRPRPPAGDRSWMVKASLLTAVAVVLSLALSRLRRGRR